MKLLNKYNLPEAIVKAVSAYNYPPKEGRYSVTDLIAPPQIRQLKIKFWNSLEGDVSERLWALLGQACHAVLDASSPEDAISENKLVVEFGGVTLSGKSDLYHNGNIEDYKIVSVYSFLLEGGKAKKEWEQQCNIYAWMHQSLGMSVKELWIRAILRDWQGSKAKQDADYPPIPFQSVSVPLWGIEGQERYLRARLEAHKALNPQCSDEERWKRGEAYRVVKKDRKTAIRVLPTQEDAERFILINNLKDATIVKKEGEFMRCNNYCVVSKVCPQNAEAKNDEKNT